MQPSQVAECANCASWRATPGLVPGHATAVQAPGVCLRGLAPPEGEPRCDAYRISPAFERSLVRQLMRDPVLVPVPLKSRRKGRKR